MLFAAEALFKPGIEPERDRLHEAFGGHLAQLALGVRLAGVLRDKHGERRGVLLLVEAPDWASAEAFVAASPYAGLYARVEISELTIEAGRLV
ncbi:YciI family protein [Sphingosinicella sp. BN140058]|uniref:YciI family protein n=1 Tax=Sphingosinicella sp. BN140058 TaxID=1892855 RepID=UPI00101217AF|nr:YciI family protein [Sphingosinicella sp. BN140058]QAY79073.1 YciI family protein [Sphingosinicella sp. BN140058]